MLVTAFGREEVREEAEQLGIDGFLVKPVTKSMLVDTLVNVFAPGSEEIAHAASDDRHAGRLRGARILLTEDNEINQQIAVELLEGVGAQRDRRQQRPGSRRQLGRGSDRPSTWC